MLPPDLPEDLRSHDLSSSFDDALVDLSAPGSPIFAAHAGRTDSSEVSALVLPEELSDRVYAIARLAVDEPTWVVLREQNQLVAGWNADGSICVLDADLIARSWVEASGLRGSLLRAVLGEPAPSPVEFLRRWLIARAAEAGNPDAGMMSEAVREVYLEGILSWSALAGPAGEPDLKLLPEAVIAVLLLSTQDDISESLILDGRGDLVAKVTAQFDADGGPAPQR